MAALEPDRGQIEIFVEAIFRYAGKQGFVAVRSFFDDEDKPFRLNGTPLTGGLRFLIDVAEDDARRAAQYPRPIVFCPPLAVFSDKDRAREQDLVAGLALSVECDEYPQQARAKLEALIGPATIVVRSGGRWSNGNGESEDKLHLHWRLAAPASGDALKKLKRARDIAARIVGGDPSNKSVVHPIRWPGSWHRKAAPRLCQIKALDPDREIDLAGALDVLIQAAPEAAKSKDNTATGKADQEDWPELVGDIITGRSFHQPLVSLAARLVGSGTRDGTTVNLLRAIMSASTAEHDPRRWQARFDAIPRVVRSARDKYAGDNKTSEATHTAAEPLEIFDAGNDTELPPPREWLLANQFCRKFLSSLVAPGAAGKTALRIAQLLSLAISRSLTGQHVFKHCRVLLLSFEDGRDELRRRVAAACIHHGIERSELKGRLYYATPKGIKLAELDNGTRKRGGLEKHLRRKIQELKPDIVCLDPFIKTHGLEENDNNAMDFVCDLLATFADEFNIAVDAPHHTRKGAATPGDADMGRGGSSIRDAGRLVYTLTPMDEAEAKQFGIDQTDRRDYIRLDSAKVNIVRSARAATWFKLISVSIGNATADYPAGDEVQTVEPWIPPDTWADLDNAALNLILNKIDTGMADGNRYTDAPNVKDRAAWKVVVEHAPNKNEAQAREIIKTWVKNGVLENYPYKNPVTFKEVSGLRVNNARRPGSTT
jgi:hypothetical protein